MKKRILSIKEIPYEKSFLDMLGLTLVKDAKSKYKWLILDENEVVGVVSKKIKSQNGNETIYEYKTLFEPSKLKINLRRKSNKLIQNYYECNIDTEDGIVNVKIRLEPKIGIYLEDCHNNLSEFTLSDNHLFLYFSRKINGYKVKERLVYDKQDATDYFSPVGTYEYSLLFCKEDEVLEERKNRQALVLYCKERPKTYGENLKVCTQVWQKGKVVENIESLVLGNIEEVAFMHHQGIDSLQDFKKYVDDVIGIDGFFEKVLDGKVNREEFKMMLGFTNDNLKKTLE